MEITPIVGPGVGAEHLLGPSIPNADPAQATVAAQDFEAVFMSMMIKQMRETLDEGFFGGESSDALGGMFDMYMGKHLADSSTLGVKQMVNAYLENQK